VKQLCNAVDAVQLSFDLEPGLVARFPQWEDVIAAAVYGSRKGLNGIAAELDMSPSELTRRLNRNSDESRPLRVHDAVRIVDATGDLRPVYWLVERFLQTDSVRREQAISQIATLLPVLTELVAQAGVGKPRK
jgi:hypothetical protein